MKKSVFSETEKAFISEKISSKKKNLRGTFPDLSVKSLHQHPWHVILYSLVFLYGITSTAVDLCVLPLTMVAAWLLVRLDFIQ